MSVFDIFRKGAIPMAASSPTMNMSDPSQMQQQQQQPNAPALQTQTGAPATNPQALLEADKNKQSPDVDYSKLWEPDANARGPANLAEFSFNMDPAKINQTIGGLDFTKVVSPDITAKIAAGGQEAVSAMLTAMNSIAQEATKAALLSSVRVAETGIRTTGQRVQDNLPALVRNETVSGALREDNPLFNDPSTAPMMELVTQQMAMKFPQATPAEIRKHAMQYMSNFATNAAKFTGKQVVDMPTQQQQNQRIVQTDWSGEPV